MRNFDILKKYYVLFHDYKHSWTFLQNSMLHFMTTNFHGYSNRVLSSIQRLQTFMDIFHIAILDFMTTNCQGHSSSILCEAYSMRIRQLLLHNQISRKCEILIFVSKQKWTIWADYIISLLYLNVLWCWYL